MNINAKKYIVIYAITFTLAVIFIAGLTVYIDPYFHYHKPVDGFTYTLDNQHQRYYSYGILKNFDYGAMIIGTSMTENFKSSEFDSLFGVNSIKTPLMGGRFKEIDQAVNHAINKNENLNLVIRGLDLNMIILDKDASRNELSWYPWYLYDDNIFNDVSYVFNKEILITTTVPVYKTKGNTAITSFDDYSNWMNDYNFGKETTLKSYNRATNKVNEQVSLNDAQIKTINDNIQQNIVETISSNPNVEFYYFLTPFNILYWDSLERSGTLISNFETHKILIEALLPYENCKLFSFNTEFEIITNLDNYKDTTHYIENVNSYMLEQMAKGENLLTYDNYEQYLQECYDFYSNYDYDAIFE